MSSELRFFLLMVGVSCREVGGEFCGGQCSVGVCGQYFTVAGVTNYFLYGSESCGEASAGLVDGVGVCSVDSGLEFLERLE